MKLKALLSVYGLFMIVTGTAFFAFPSGVLGLYGAPPLNVLEGSLARSLGALMVGVGTMSWASRARGVAKSRDPLMLGLVITNALWTAACFLTGLSIRGHWFFWAEGAGFAVVTFLFIWIWHREVSATAGPAVNSE